MSQLLEEIRRLDPEAALVLERAELRADADIRSLARVDLCELFPEPRHFKLRRRILEILHKQNPADLLINELKGFIPHDSLRAALSNNGVLVNYLPMLKDMKTQVDSVQNFLDAHIDFLEEFRTNQPAQEYDKDSPSGTSASASCGPEEHHSGQTEGFPKGVQDAPCTSGQTGPNTVPTDDHPHRSGGKSNFTSSCGPEEHHSGQTEGLPKGVQGTAASCTSDQMGCYTGSEDPHGYENATSGQMWPNTVPTDDYPHRSGGSSFFKSFQPSFLQGLSFPQFNIFKSSPQDFREVKCRKVVSGKTFGADVQLMDKMKVQHQNRVQLQIIESSEDYQITIVFCPISSRVASDVDAAMTDVNVSTDSKPVILVLMHHVHEVRVTSSMRTWSHDAKVVLHANVFYHETMRGLLKCNENDDAASDIRKKLLEFSIRKSEGISGNALGGVSESGKTGSNTCSPG